MKEFRDTGYKITKEGDLFNRFGKKMAGSLSNGYKGYVIYVEQKAYRFLAHRMVAETYIPNHDNKPQVNHMDGDKLNNNVSNLEWVTCKENHEHAKRTGLTSHLSGLRAVQAQCREVQPNTKKIVDTTTGKVYDSIADAALDLGINRKTLSRWIKQSSNKTNLEYAR